MPSSDGLREKLHRINEGWEMGADFDRLMPENEAGLRSCRIHHKNMTLKNNSGRPLTCGRLIGRKTSARRSLLAGITSGLVLFGALTQQLHAASWTSFTIDSFASSSFRATALAHLPDGRFVYGVAGELFVQDVFGAVGKTSIPAGALTLDPSFIAVRDAASAIVGQGGFAAISNVFSFNPSLPATGVNPAPLASPQNYTGEYWKSPTSALEGWLVGGGNGEFGAHNVVFISLDGTKTGPVTETISTFSGGIAVDAAGNLYTATYELDFDTFEPTADADKVLKFDATLVEVAIQAVINSTPAPIPVSSSTFIYKFDGTSNIAVDSLGRVWAAGYAVNHLQVFDPATQTMSRIVPSHGSFPPGTDVLYTVRNFMRSGAGYLAFLAQDEYGNAGTNVYTGYAPDSSIIIPHMDQWRAQKFGVHNLTLASQSSLWGNDADPDHDGRGNLIECAEGTEPNIPDVSPITITAPEGILQFSFLRDPLNTDVTCVVEVSVSLAPDGWQEIARSTGGAATVSSGIGAGSVNEVAEGALIRVNVTNAAEAVHRFARLRVILNTP